LQGYQLDDKSSKGTGDDDKNEIVKQIIPKGVLVTNFNTSAKIVSLLAN